MSAIKENNTNHESLGNIEELEVELTLKQQSNDKS